MIPLHEWLLFIAACLVLVLTPGPNMIYVMSRSIVQGSRAGVISLFGVVAGFLVHMFATAVGLSALFLAVPFAFDLLKWAGAAYLLYLAWLAVRPGGGSPFEPRPLPPDPPRKLFVMGFATNLLNPKVAFFYISLFPQFIDPSRGPVLLQSVLLGLTQIAVSFSVNFVILLSAAGIATWFARNPLWLAVQRWVMGIVLAGLAVRLALEQARR